MKKSTGIKKVMQKVSMMQIPENALLDGVLRALEGREAFRDTDGSLNERIFTGDVFEAILGENAQFEERHPMRLGLKTEHQLEELAKLVNTEYVQITMI